MKAREYEKPPSREAHQENKKQKTGQKAAQKNNGREAQSKHAPREDSRNSNRQNSQMKSRQKHQGVARDGVLKRHSSLVSRISASYTNMFASWLSLSLTLMFFMTIAGKAFFIYWNDKSFIDEILIKESREEWVQTVNSSVEMDAMLLDQNSIILADSFNQLSEVGEIWPFDYYTIDRSVYLTYSDTYFLQDGPLRLVLFTDITQMIIEIMAAGAVGIVLFIVSMLVIYVRGNYLTRKAFRVFDELLVKANNISSQNLNLRLNVSDTTDELIEFSLTFNRMMDRLEKSYEKQQQFVSDASHELRTPISVIQGYARMLERWGKDDPEILQESISAINKESKAMQDLVEKLLFIARNDKDTLVLVKVDFNLSELVSETVRETRMLETGHTISDNVTSDIWVYGDRDRIKQSIRIFIDNALKYTEKTGTIALSLAMENGQAVVTVRDTGIGIPEKDLANIFDRFYRVDSARERNTGGHGLGLSIARIIVLRHEGRIKVGSKVGSGTRFSICLPAKQRPGTGSSL